MLVDLIFAQVGGNAAFVRKYLLVLVEIPCPGSNLLGAHPDDLAAVIDLRRAVGETFLGAAQSGIPSPTVKIDLIIIVGGAAAALVDHLIGIIDLGQHALGGEVINDEFTLVQIDATQTNTRLPGQVALGIHLELPVIHDVVVADLGHGSLLIQVNLPIFAVPAPPGNIALVVEAEFLGLPDGFAGGENLTGNIQDFGDHILRRPGLSQGQDQGASQDDPYNSIESAPTTHKHSGSPHAGINYEPQNDKPGHLVSGNPAALLTILKTRGFPSPVLGVGFF